MVNLTLSQVVQNFKAIYVRVKFLSSDFRFLVWNMQVLQGVWF